MATDKPNPENRHAQPACFTSSSMAASTPPLMIPISSNTIPARWIDEIFARFTGRWRNRWMNDFEDPLYARAIHQQWAEDLAGMTAAQIGEAIRNTRDLEWPPTPAEFRRAGGLAPGNAERGSPPDRLADPVAYGQWWVEAWVKPGRAVGVEWRNYAGGQQAFMDDVIAAERGRA